jgi:hypothetical protein
MPQVINLRDVVYKRRDARSCQRLSRDGSASAAAALPAGRPALDDADIDRAIMLLDAAAEQARLVVMQSNDGFCRARVEAQTAGIVRLLGLAGRVTARLEQPADHPTEAR